MAGDRARRDVNNVDTLLATSNDGQFTPVAVYADPTTHALLITGSLTIGGSAIPASGATTAVTVQIVDGSGNQITSFGGGTQYTDGGVPPAHPIGGTLEWSDGANWQTVSTAKPLPVTVGSHPVTNAGTFAVQATEADGANTTLGSKADAKNTATDTTAITVMSVLKQISASVQAPPSQAVTNGGTFAVQATLQANSGVDIGKLTANQSVNVAQINGVTPLMGNGVTGTGSQRVTIASDNTAFGVNATLSAETTKVIGTVNIAAAQTIGITANSSVNVAQINGITPLMGNGTSGTGAQRVTLASDSTGQVKLAASSGTDIGALTANQTVNLNQLAGNTISSGVGVSGTGTLRVVEANDVGRTLKSAGGSASSSGNNTLVAAGTNKLKIFAFSLTTTSTTSVTCIFQSGASGTELWRVVLQAPTGVNVGANLAVAVPGYLFTTASATLLNLNLSGAQTVHWSVAYFDES